MFSLIKFKMDLFQFFWWPSYLWSEIKVTMFFNTSRCKYHEMKAEIMFYHLMLIYWSQMTSANRKNKQNGHGLAVPILLYFVRHNLDWLLKMNELLFCAKLGNIPNIMLHNLYNQFYWMFFGFPSQRNMI